MRLRQDWLNRPRDVDWRIRASLRPLWLVGSAGRVAYLVCVIWHGKGALVLLRRSWQCGVWAIVLYLTSEWFNQYSNVSERNEFYVASVMPPVQTKTGFSTQRGQTQQTVLNICLTNTWRKKFKRKKVKGPKGPKLCVSNQFSGLPRSGMIYRL